MSKRKRLQRYAYGLWPFAFCGCWMLLVWCESDGQRTSPAIFQAELEFAHRYVLPGVVQWQPPNQNMPYHAMAVYLVQYGPFCLEAFD